MGNHTGVSPGGPQGREGDLPVAARRRWISFPASPRMSSAFGRASLRWCLFAPLALTACQQHNAYMPGTPEYAAAMVSRGYDCGLRVERGRVVAVYQGDERRRLIAANQDFAVRSYNLPRACTETERAAVASELRAIARR